MPYRKGDITPLEKALLFDRILAGAGYKLQPVDRDNYGPKGFPKRGKSLRWHELKHKHDRIQKPS